MELGERNRSLAEWTGRADHRLERGERHTHIGGMDRDAALARALDRVDPVDARDRATAAAWLALVAWRGHVVEVVAARPLHQVAAIGRDVAQLGRGPGEDRGREQRIPLRDALVIRGRGVRHECAEAQPTTRPDADQRSVSRPRYLAGELLAFERYFATSTGHSVV